MKLKRMACILDEDTVLERYLCPVCDKVHFGEWYAEEYLEYMNEGPVVGKYEGWDDALEILCNDCTRGAKFFFGDRFITSLQKEDDSDVVKFLAIVSRFVRDCITRGSRINGSEIKRFIEKRTFMDGSKVRFLGGNWVLVRSETRLKYGIRPVSMGIVKESGPKEE